MNLIAYTYEADVHCIGCTKTYVHVDRWKFLCSIPQHPSGCWCVSASRHYDNNGVGHDQKDREGNLVHPLFSTDEWQELDESFLLDYPIQYLVCGDCHEVIEEYTHEAGFA